MKKLLDFTTALIVLSFIFSIFLLVTICLFISNKGKPFFFQIRPGKMKNFLK